ncbi:hypothetical protein KL930_000891 [Ogataea haglerorum]|uniref:Mitochondrial ATPase complex subunit ATP10 n=1 Tax=Ogataea haglerorum TaxID=1937702 RepID=A0AAN6DB41_9ASCO|nr:uncharacterized protein KL911_003574 [Ogataea haglerorum]KAG7700203.1 hypothetical protein KL915_000892 [Ogataea haglerorum]KAG7701861.1 hypothetical protein KL951_000317 [Ogataea haglerorum]KAG7711674.1 hypothetical protein KL914_000316 [Ogataea haglerorum]KAG7712446.1 hypothetical protein KL950_000317 [Ogataea haglerorum]KAG7722498.1 hypothetical protein KL913_000318 [Ogataea haglerorum]
MSLTSKRHASFFGNLGDNISKIVPKPHRFFKVTKPFGFEKPPVHLRDLPRKKWLTKENLNVPKRIWDFYFDGITRRTRVDKIQKELAYGGMYDFHVYMKTKGRLFEAPVSFFKRDKSLFFPNFLARTLSERNVELMDVLKQAKVTVLKVYSADSGKEMVADYFKIPNSDDSYLSKTGIDEFHKSFPQSQIVELLLSEKWSNHFVHTYVTPRKLRAEIPESQHDKFLVALRDAVLSREDREKLLMTNTYAGYVYLIDDSFRIRWVGCGQPDEKEVQGLWKALKGLERETGRKLVKTR